MAALHARAAEARKPLDGLDPDALADWEGGILTPK
jgi:hypothetical protein